MKRLYDIRNMGFSYDHKRVLKNVDLTIESGKFYGILGPNGCGKTTLIDLMMGLQHPDQGKVYYKDRRIDDYRRKALAKEMALVPQNFYINFSFTVYEVILMGRSPYLPRFGAPSIEDIDIVEEAMAKTGVTQFKHRYITELSGGERQRVVFTRGLVQDTPVLFLDEATSNMDIRHTLTMMDVLKDAVHHRQKTVISVFQDINLATTYATDFIFMKEGTVVSYGEKNQILTDEMINHVFGIKAHIYHEPFSNSDKIAFIG